MAGARNYFPHPIQRPNQTGMGPGAVPNFGNKAPGPNGPRNDYNMTHQGPGPSKSYEKPKMAGPPQQHRSFPKSEIARLH
jgi:hypothetical protein